jgi:hypothetical protein
MSKLLWFGAGMATSSMWNSYKHDLLDEAKLKKVSNINKFIAANMLRGTAGLLNSAAYGLYNENVPSKKIEKEMFEYDPILDNIFEKKVRNPPPFQGGLVQGGLVPEKYEDQPSDC